MSWKFDAPSRERADDHYAAHERAAAEAGAEFRRAAPQKQIDLLDKAVEDIPEEAPDFLQFDFDPDVLVVEWEGDADEDPFEDIKRARDAAVEPSRLVLKEYWRALRNSGEPIAGSILETGVQDRPAGDFHADPARGSPFQLLLDCRWLCRSCRRRLRAHLVEVRALHAPPAVKSRGRRKSEAPGQRRRKQSEDYRALAALLALVQETRRLPVRSECAERADPPIAPSSLRSASRVPEFHALYARMEQVYGTRDDLPSSAVQALAERVGALLIKLDRVLGCRSVARA